MKEEENVVKSRKGIGGRPKSFESPEQMETLAEGYFQMRDAENRGEGLPYTIEGLCLWLYITTETLRAYGEKEEFSVTVKMLKMRVLDNVQTGSLIKKLDGRTATLVMQTLGNYTAREGGKSVFKVTGTVVYLPEKRSE